MGDNVISATATACARRCSGRRIATAVSRAPTSPSSRAAADGPGLRLPGRQRRGPDAPALQPAALAAALISLRKEHPVFGFGSYEPLTPSNPRIFAHIRSYEGDVMLCVHNLARSARPSSWTSRPSRARRRWRSSAARAFRGSGTAVPADARPARFLLVPAREGRA